MNVFLGSVKKENSRPGLASGFPRTGSGSEHVLDLDLDLPGRRRLIPGQARKKSGCRIFRVTN